MCEKVTARCNWLQTAGNQLTHLVVTRLVDDDVFVKPELDDVINEERAVLFASSENPPPPCELRFQIHARFKIAALTLVCSAPKLELFIGPSQEYLQTVYGVCVEDEDADVPVRPYRYDMEIDRSGIALLNLKMLTSANEICIYGAMLHIGPNPNGITTQLPRPVEIQNVQDLLQKAGSSIAKEVKKPEKLEAKDAEPTTDLSVIKDLIDKRFLQLNQLITKRLNDFEAKQTQKLDRILFLLDKKQR
ncbi:hypothetical protein KR074_004295 [Drosophila pseudoananassae]|nr:hypothetical protein KR074_004295 [Drosophila pseudoananassae]